MPKSKKYEEVVEHLLASGWCPVHESTEEIMGHEFHIDLWSHRDRGLMIRHTSDGISGMYGVKVIPQEDQNRSPTTKEMVAAIRSK